MTDKEEGVRGASTAPATDETTVSPDEQLVRAAARILARHRHPDWRPTGEDLDGYGHGWHDGHAQGYADGRSA